MTSAKTEQEAGGVADVEESRPTLRLCRILKHVANATTAAAGAPSCGFHISRTQWDPYPWVSAVEVGSPAEQAGLRAGDCVLEVNGEDVLGQRIGEVAAKLTAGSAPTPLNLQLLSSCLQQASQLLECPVCLEAVSPPVWQCCHGHLLCSGEDLSDVADAVAELALPALDVAVPPANARARSQSAGHIGAHVAKAVSERAGGLVHCPYGSTCSSTFPASEVFQHLSEDHDGPLTQYFPREGRALSLPHPGHSQAGQRRHSLTVLTTKAGESLFLHEERGCLWLWTLAVAADDAPAATDAVPADVVPEPFLCVDFPDAVSGHTMVPVFPLSASSDDVIASGRCVHVPDNEVLRISVRVGRDAPPTTPSSTPSSTPSAPPALVRTAAVS
ncbi:uncharacterized protein LOC117647467 [Thrips palmi]|uniref:Uncharacterized protein LOC117647467 n=1 Tax=Thrips palmi TaxID=161013 RepID=A0A6P8YY82_THRPL|nr:uncharacterized protein LOC117647467 [Thrips palmi]